MSTTWRENLYPANCSICGVRLEEKAGFYRVEEPKGRIFYCATDKAAYDLDPTIQPQPSFTRNAAEPQVTAPAIDIDALAKATADLTFTKVAEHFVGAVLPEVETALPNLVKKELSKLTRVAEIKVGKAPAVKLNGKAHKLLPTILQAIAAGVKPFMVGPAGSGKTTLGEQCAEVMKLPFYFASRVTSEFKLIGYVNAMGATVRTPFREAFEYGGVFLFDEIDASDADAFTTFNAALSNRICDFPDAVVRAHKDFYAIAAGNTYGRGADRQYVGRTQLDAATLDRFCVFEVDYDEQLEDELAGNLEWSGYIQKVRRVITAQQVRHLCSPRASIEGAKMLAAGMDRNTVAEAVLWKGLDASVRRRIEEAVTYA